ncbi:MAG: prepilin-type N-terminal cleavage/methylation domain-containing protein, partial [Lachnospiraceae bacterium]|nr:prepilin-type N-terminal cleavage/methylation domain-containing protein [Lachnospiraceae bacterium]
MKRTARIQKKNKLNSRCDRGFTLIEVLVAVIIIAIVAIPVLKAFVTSANTTGKSKMKMRATNAAENIMEDLVSLSVEQAVKKYSLGTITEPTDLGRNGDSEIVKQGIKEAYTISVTGENDKFDTDLNEALKAGYQAEIFIDPSWYSNSNGLNVSNFDILSSDIAAIFSMTPELNNAAYKAFVMRQTEYYKAKYPDEASRPAIWNAEKFKTNGLYREIRLDIEKTGTITNEDGESYPKVTVTVTVSYLLKDNVNTDDPGEKLVDDNDTTYVALNRQIFSNAVSEKKLSSIFIMYYPLYSMAKKNGDIITVHNHDDIEADFYVVAQDVDKDATEFASYRKNTTGGLILSIYEDEINDEISGEKKQPLRLRTNLIDESKVAYVSLTKDENNIVPVQCFLKVNKSSADQISIGDPFDESCWNKIKNSKGDFEEKKATKALNAGALDG